MKRRLIASAVVAAFVAAPSWAARDAHDQHHPGNATAAVQIAQMPATKGQAMGPGMMGQGMGPGMMGQGGYGMGPGMMGQGGYGMGPGMMGGGMMGPGMMGQGMGPGMMGPGMMGQGMGPGMMGPGMMGAQPFANLNLSAEQRGKIAQIQQDVWRKNWDLMGKMHEERFHMHQLFSGAEADDSAARKAFQAMADAHKQMFEAMLDARKRINAVLTDEQRKQLKGG